MFRPSPLLVVVMLAALSCAGGCKNNPYMAGGGFGGPNGVNGLSGPSGPNVQDPLFFQQQQALAQQGAQIQGRAESLDRDNRDLQGQLAQSQKQSRLLEEQLTVVRQQLQSTTQSLASLRNEKQGLERHTQALAASVERRAAATIRPNNSLTKSLTVATIPGVEVRQDGDLIRIELPGERLFHPGSAVLRPEATQVIDGVMADVMNNYPSQRLGIEGHTDSDPIRSTQFPTNHHLSLARATAVYEQISRRSRVPEQQFFVVGHGSNHPVVSNATDAGKSRNRRVEIVVYPETVGG